MEYLKYLVVVLILSLVVYLLLEYIIKIVNTNIETNAKIKLMEKEAELDALRTYNEFYALSKYNKL